MLVESTKIEQHVGVSHHLFRLQIIPNFNTSQDLQDNAFLLASIRER